MSFPNKRARGVVSQSQSDEVQPRRRLYPKKKLVSKAVSQSRSMAVKAIVNRTINRLTETKIARYNFNGDIAYYNGTIFASGAAIFPISPYSGYLSIAQGSGQGDRIGNSIRPYSVKLRMTFQPQPYDATFNPVPKPHIIRMVVFKSKQYGGATLQTSLPNFFNVGNSSAAPVTSLADTVNPINTDLYHVYVDQLIKLGCADNTGTGAQAGYQYNANNDYQLNPCMEIDITRFLPKKITFNDTSALALSDTEPLYCTFLACPATGQTPTAGNAQTPCFVWGCLDFKFKDA